MPRATTEQAQPWTLATMDGIADGIVLRGPDGRVADVNDAFCRMTGFTKDELVGAALPDRFWPAEHVAGNRRILAAFMGGRGGEYDIHFCRKSGERFLGSIHASPLKDAAGAVRGCLVVVRETRRPGEGLSEASRRRREFLEALPQLVWTADAAGRATYFSQRWVDFSGRPAEQLQADGWQSLVHEEDVGEAAEAWRQAVGSGEAFATECRFRAKDGTHRWHLVHAARVHDSVDGSAFWVGACTDVHEHRVQRELLAESEERYRLLVDGVRDVATLMLDVAGHVISWSDAAERLKGYKAVEIVGQHFRTFFPPDVAAAGKPERLLETARIHGRTEDEGWRVRKDGSRFWANVHLSALRDDRGRLRGFAKVTRDFTERKRAEESLRQRAAELSRLTHQLKRKNAELDQFAYITSHDLKAPLRGIANLSEWIEEDMGDRFTPEARQQMDLLRGRVHRMEALIDGILQISRVGRVRAEPERVDLTALAREVVDLMHPPEGVSVEVADGMPVVTAERLRLEQVLMNLIGNAIKHGRSPGGPTVIRVSARPAADDEGRVEVSVSDNGPGIAPEYHEKIFVVFQTLAARDKVEGTGIGLSLVKKIVEDQGGQVTVDSREGAGATFAFTWPTAPVSRGADGEGQTKG